MHILLRIKASDSDATDVVTLDGFFGTSGASLDATEAEALRGLQVGDRYVLKVLPHDAFNFTFERIAHAPHADPNCPACVPRAWRPTNDPLIMLADEAERHADDLAEGAASLGDPME